MTPRRGSFCDRCGVHVLLDADDECCPHCPEVLCAACVREHECRRASARRGR
jgi:hypothetical protein